MNYCIFDNFIKNLPSINLDDLRYFLEKNNIIFIDYENDNDIIIDDNDINKLVQNKIKDTLPFDLRSYVKKRFKNYSDVQINGVIALFCYWYDKKSSTPEDIELETTPEELIDDIIKYIHSINKKNSTTPEDIELEKTPEDLNAAIIAFVDCVIKAYLRYLQEEKEKVDVDIEL
ncbi:hypothetical protein [Ruminococcus albus]|uniref:Uncharacterized protein n=1 Tax=Ruminococcus albus TaxID=1264 RepID=A0A1I1PK46_RUMAL|nr:hypothetical protein [Ruminococcus albus]SFD10239.1 hypothetical protein SAMN02910406_03101 [Ruminococcus albus]